MRVTGRTTKMCEKAVEKFGEEAQLVILIEECSELTKEATKMLRGHGRRENMIEELADVAVMCEQLRIMLGLSDDQLEDMAKTKMMRTMERCGIENY